MQATKENFTIVLNKPKYAGNVCIVERVITICATVATVLGTGSMGLLPSIALFLPLGYTRYPMI